MPHERLERVARDPQGQYSGQGVAGPDRAQRLAADQAAQGGSDLRGEDGRHLELTEATQLIPGHVRGGPDDDQRAHYDRRIEDRHGRGAQCDSRSAVSTLADRRNFGAARMQVPRSASMTISRGVPTAAPRTSSASMYSCRLFPSVAALAW
ncbi:MAG TPA: hypothetical protein VMU94_07080 [Streptosporangiaceae bacterium]|nr:hypothetical protein [Streptosporangiaceae bacterium]